MLFDKIKLMAQVIGFICIGLLAVYGGVVAATGGPPAWAAGDAAPAAPEAITPALISYQGTLRDDSDDLANGTYDMVVAICQNEDGTGQLWSETHNDVEVREGHFSLLLGETNSLSREDFVDDPSLYIELTVDGQVMTPRQRFAAVPYAISATYATKLSAPDGDPAEAMWVSDDGDVHVGSSDQQSTMVAIHGITPTLRFNHRDGKAEVDLMANGGELEIREPDDGDDLWLKINNDGQVGIGKDPEVKLDVDGWASVGRLGIGTTSPDTDLSVIGVVRGADTVTETEYTEIGHGGGNGYINTVGDGDLKFRHDGDNKMSLNDSGDLNVTGNLNADSLTIDEDKPIVFVNYHKTGDHYYDYRTNKSTSYWVCGIAGFKASGDFDENCGDCNIMEAYAYPKDGKWRFHLDFSSENGNEEWYVTLLCVKKDIAEWNVTHSDGQPH